MRFLLPLPPRALQARSSRRELISEEGERMGFLGSWEHLIIHPSVAKPKYSFLFFFFFFLGHKVSLTGSQLPDKDGIYSLCSGSGSLNHWTARKFPKYIFLISCCIGLSYKVGLREETQLRRRRRRKSNKGEQSTPVNSLTPEFIRTSEFTLSGVTHVLPQCRASLVV